MHNLRHFYYQNKQKIWKVVLIIAFLLGIIYFLNARAEEKSDQKLYTSDSSNVNFSDEQNKTYIAEESALTGEKVTDKEVQKINSTIRNFLQYCKNGNAEEAYNMLSNDCKENQYSTLEKFKEKYLKTRFGKNSIYEIEKWINNTYKISISKDLLVTGDVNSNEKQIEYITMVTENMEEKLNINSFVGTTYINKEITQNQVKITVISKKTYIDYEIYNFKIENLSSKTIKIDSLEKKETIYIQDSMGNKSNAYIHEISEDELVIKSNHQFKIDIKFASIYADRKEIEQVVFEEIILDYIEYKKTENKENFKNICQFKIKL